MENEFARRLAAAERQGPGCPATAEHEELRQLRAELKQIKESPSVDTLSHEERTELLALREEKAVLLQQLEDAVPPGTESEQMAVYRGRVDELMRLLDKANEDIRRAHAEGDAYRARLANERSTSTDPAETASELESLQAVLDMKTKELRELRARNNTLDAELSQIRKVALRDASPSCIFRLLGLCSSLSLLLTTDGG